METQHHGFQIRKNQCVFVSALIGTITMFTVLVAAVTNAPEAAFIGILGAGFAGTIAAALVSQFCRR